MEARQFSRVLLDRRAFLWSDRDSAQGALLNLSRTGALLLMCFYRMAPMSITRWSKTAGVGGIENTRQWMWCWKG
jgi:hypothetical protein